MDVDENQPETPLWYCKASGYRKRFFGSVESGFDGELNLDSGFRLKDLKRHK
jgi:hypothetical protein